MTCTRPLRKLGLRKPLPPHLEGFGGGSHLMGCSYPCHYHTWPLVTNMPASVSYLYPPTGFQHQDWSCGGVARPSDGGKNLLRS